MVDLDQDRSSKNVFNTQRKILEEVLEAWNEEKQEVQGTKM